ncbi:hypothetical protein BUALT_Bualt09G0005800 [Buddleja alternifolia]|uniref:Uncharacterized protein n=1 Tax=Buddleja alternifolia TaxID=168488 RepID=A0AAV6X625_9LAMI|nr:hypothetical protein BUALT_Bualt09G0005800 [Buddleja alternifolia]
MINSFNIKEYQIELALGRRKSEKEASLRIRNTRRRGYSTIMIFGFAEMQGVKSFFSQSKVHEKGAYIGDANRRTQEEFSYLLADGCLLLLQADGRNVMCDAVEKFHTFVLVVGIMDMELSNETGQCIFERVLVSVIDSTMKKYADNLIYAIDGLSARVSQLETRTHNLENSVDDMKVSLGNNHGSIDGKMRQMENILREPLSMFDDLKLLSLLN